MLLLLHAPEASDSSVHLNHGLEVDANTLLLQSIKAELKNENTKVEDNELYKLHAQEAYQKSQAPNLRNQPASAKQELKTVIKGIEKDNKLYAEKNPAPHEKPIMDQVKELFDLGNRDPERLIQVLNDTDPFGVSSGPNDFLCPVSRIQQLGIIDNTRLNDFVQGKSGSWIFYQHLRKAGGTGFCQLAKDNLGKNHVPPYYCMVDDRGSLATPPWNNPQYLSKIMQDRDFRMTSNEWDVFYKEMFNWPGAIFATTIRDPIDRIYSQYRFEHLERRDGASAAAPRMSAKDYYLSIRGWTMGNNYYIKTFVGESDKIIAPAKTGDFYWTYHKYHNKKVTWNMFESAMQNIMKYHLIFVTEWLEPSSSVILNKSLGWKVPPKQVLPHEQQAIRLNKKSPPASELLPKEDYLFLLKDNILDLLFFRTVQRMYLERLKC
jgi:hypothetical protein